MCLSYAVNEPGAALRYKQLSSHGHWREQHPPADASFTDNRLDRLSQNSFVNPSPKECLPGSERNRPLIFLLEEDQSLASLICGQLELAGYRVSLFSTPATALVEAERLMPALFILETMLPGEGGLELCRKIRSNGMLAGIPVIFVTVRSAEADRILGLDAGADDYITKPFSPRELVARIHAILRRSEMLAKPESLSVGALTIDLELMSVTIAGRSTLLTVSEFRLLRFLMQHPGRAFTREQIVQMVWPQSRYVSPRAVDVCIRRIRAKIEPNPQVPRHVLGIRGIGYRLSKS